MTYEEFIKKAFVRVNDKNVIFPSEVGVCVRRSYFSRQEEFMDIGFSEFVDIGVIYHETIQTYFKNNLNCEIEKVVEGEIEGFKISGRADIVCGQDLLELKVVSYIPFQPRDHHLQQVALYYYLLKQQNYNIQNVYLIYIKRDNIQIKEYKIDENLLQISYQKALEFIRKLKEVLQTGDYRKIPMADQMFCKNCIFKAKCYGYFLFQQS